MMDFAVWTEIDPDQETATTYMAGRGVIDEMASQEEKYFRTAQLDQRKREFVSRSIYAFIMEGE